MRAPAVNGGSVVNQRREWIFQRGSTDLLWRFIYSASAGFTGGSPSISVTPTAADEVYMAGAGAGTFLSFMPTNGAYHFHVMCGGAAEFYSFIAWCATNSTGLATTAVFMDALATGTHAGASDPDPCVTGAGTSLLNINGLVGATASITNVTNPAGLRSWLGPTSAAQAATTLTNSQGVIILSFGNNAMGGSASLGTNPHTGRDAVFPQANYSRSGTTAPLGPKGTSTLFALSSMARAEMDTVDDLTTKDRICIGTSKILAPWNGSVPVI
jgi:hypothetical protein